MARRGLVWRALVIACVSGAIVLLTRGIDWEAWLSGERIGEALGQAGPLAPLAFIVVMACAIVISPIPSLPLDLAAGAFFGWFLGGLYASIGATLGAVAAFGIARGLGRAFVERMIGGHVVLCTECSNHTLTWAVFGSRLIPAVSFDLVSYAAGLTKLSFGRFVLATFLGVLPLTFTYTAFGPALWFWIGDSLGLWLGLLIGAGLLLVPWALERWNVLGFRKRIEHPH